MKILCCSVVIVLAIYLAIYGPYAESTVTEGSGDSACDRGKLNENDVISQKFMDDHICLVRNSPPNDLAAFCRDFREGQPKYQVMLLSPDGIKQLRNDLKGHQNELYNDRLMFRPILQGPSEIHYTTDKSFTYIYCERKQGRWNGKQKTDHYQLYIPQGTDRNPEGVYQIYHGCHPIDFHPGFCKSGPC